MLSRHLQLHIYISFFLALTACTEAPSDKSGVATYGQPVSYLHNKPITFPDFNIRYLGDPKAQDARQVAYDADLSHQFEITHKVEIIRVIWNDPNNSKRYEPFRIGNNNYYLRMKSSYFQNRALGPGELMILDIAQFQKNAPSLFKTGTSQEAMTLINQYMAYRKALQGSDWSLIKTFLSSNRQAILERSKTHAHMSEQAIVDHLALSAQRYKTLTIQKSTISPMEARLHLIAQAPEGTQIIGVSFVSEENTWKIEHETMLADDETGKQWVKLFLKPNRDHFY